VTKTKYTLKELVSKINELQTARLNWLDVLKEADPDRPDAEVNPNLFDSFNTRIVTGQITGIVMELNVMASNGIFTPRCYEIVLELDTCLDAWQDWADRVNENTAGTYDHNSSLDAVTCWQAFDRVLVKLKERPYPKPEGIASLLANEGITHLQIARIYGWKLKTGEFDLDRVKREINNPGSEYKPSEWKSPEKARKEAKLAQLWSERKAVPIRASAFHRTDPEASKKEWANPEIAPEPIEQLLRMEGMTVEQVARMKNMSVEEVQEKAAKLHIAIDHSAAIQMLPELEHDPRTPVSTLQDIQARIDKDFAESVHTYPEKNNVTKQIVAMLAEGEELLDEEIHALLVNQHSHCSVELVQRTRESFQSFQDSLAPSSHAESNPDIEPANLHQKSDAGLAKANSDLPPAVEDMPDDELRVSLANKSQAPDEPAKTNEDLPAGYADRLEGSGIEAPVIDKASAAADIAKELLADMAEVKRPDLLQKAKSLELTGYSKLRNNELREAIAKNIAEKAVDKEAQPVA